MLDDGPGLYARIMALKYINPELKIMLAIGGWEQGSAPFESGEFIFAVYFVFRIMLFTFSELQLYKMMMTFKNFQTMW